MRTTIEIPDEQRAQLLEIAGSRGEKGYSRLVQEGIDLLLKERRRKAGKIQAALAQRGTFDEEEARQLRSRVQEIRENWR